MTMIASIFIEQIRREISAEDLNGLQLIEYNDIERGTLLGSGQFGSIYEGLIKSTEKRIAIKVIVFFVDNIDSNRFCYDFFSCHRYLT